MSWYEHVSKDWVGNIDHRRKMYYDGAHSRSAAKAITAACADDVLFYVNTFCFTYDPRLKSSMLPFITYEYQDEAILELVAAIDEGVDVGIPKSRDMGASWINLVVLEWMWHFYPMKSFLMVSRNEDLVDRKGDSDSLFWKIDFLHKHQPDWLLPKGYSTSSKDCRTYLHFTNPENGSVMDGTATTGDVGRGGRRTAALLDEFGAFEVKAGYEALGATRDMTRCRIFNSTPKGSANAFYDVIHKVSAKIIRMHWSRHPKKSRGLYRSKDGKLELIDGWKGLVRVREKGDSTVRTVRFPEEYPFVLDGKLRSPWYDNEYKRCATSAEVGQELDIDFLGSDCQFFDPIAVEAYKRLFCRDPLRVGELEYDRDTFAPRGFAEGVGGRLWLWESPNREGGWPREDRFVLGCDVSAGTGASNSSCCVYRKRTGEKVAEFVTPKMLPADFARYCFALGKWFNDGRIVPDRSGPTGEVFVKTLQGLGYGNIYYQQKKIGKSFEDQPGVWLNPQAKTSCLELYRDAIARNTIVNRSSRAMDECLKFIRRMDGTIEHSGAVNTIDPGGARSAHGDITVGDVLANLDLERNPAEQPDVEPEIPRDSVAGRMAALRTREKLAQMDRLEEGW